MNKYYELIKSNIIEFDRLLLDKYHQLNLNETDAVLLIKLHNLIKSGNKFPSTSLISSQMSITEDECNRRIVDLVNNGYIDMLLSSIDSKENYSLDDTYKRLSYILENDERQIQNQEFDNKIKKIVNLLEKEWKKLLSPIELEIISNWVLDKQYLYEDIEEAVLRGLKQKQTNIKYVDRILLSMHQELEEVDSRSSDTNIKDLFEEVYLGAKRNL